MQKDEFPDHPAPPFDPARFGFTDDISWHNDSCPSFETPDGRFRLWVEHPDRNQREIEGSKRFSIAEYHGDSEFIRTIHEAESPAAMLRFLKGTEWEGLRNLDGGLFHAHVESSNFTFEAFGRSEAEATGAMVAGLDKHIEQYGSQVAHDWKETMLEDMALRRIVPGACYRDREALTSPTPAREPERER